MIYWDNAATTWPKPWPVRRAVGQALCCYGANPGRSGHRMSLNTAEMVYNCRQDVADYFGLSDPKGVIFTPNCTTGLNMVIQSIAGNGGRVLVSDLEHNAVVRPISALSARVPYDVAAWSPDPQKTLENFRYAMRTDTQLVVCMHASNVFGSVFPIREIGKMAHECGALFCVDAAQTAGVLPIHMEEDAIDYLCVAPHKGVYAPMGTGLLLCRESEKIRPFVRGGTGSYSLLADQPKELPDRLESGTINTVGVEGIRSGIQYVQRIGRERIYTHEIQCLQYIYERLVTNASICFYTPYPELGKTAPVLSLNVRGKPSEEVASLLDEHGIAVRAGLHCAPWAHRRFGTLEQGTVRLAPSACSTLEEAAQIAKVFSKIA